MDGGAVLPRMPEEASAEGASKGRREAEAAGRPLAAAAAVRRGPRHRSRSATFSTGLLLLVLVLGMGLSFAPVQINHFHTFNLLLQFHESLCLHISLACCKS